MTNDPSLTITSTIPAPEGSDSTSREGKTIPLPVTAGSNAPPAPDAPPPALVQRIGNTIYEVSFHFSTTSLTNRAKKVQFWKNVEKCCSEAGMKSEC